MLSFNAGHPLAEPVHARVLPRAEQLPLAPGGHVGGRDQLSGVHVGAFLIYQTLNRF